MLDIDIIVTEEIEDRFPLDSLQLRDYTEEVCALNGFSRGSLNIVFVDDNIIAGLNESYKHRTGATDVLSFDLRDEDSDEIEGEVYVSVERAAAQAAEYGVSHATELVRLLTHGLLHLSGRTHNNDEDLRAMTEDTERLLGLFFRSGNGEQA